MLITIGTIVYDSAENAYEVIEPIGHGSFGIVFKIKRQTDDAIYALKTLPTEFLGCRSLDRRSRAARPELFYVRSIIELEHQSRAAAGDTFGNELAELLGPRPFIQQPFAHKINQPAELVIGKRDRRCQ
jgi:serine/threonine protein kinase